MAKFKYATTILLLIVVAAIVAALLHAPVPQDPGYHVFADTRAVAGVNNFWNVFSNVPFLLIGVDGMSCREVCGDPGARSASAAPFAGVLVVGVGCGW